MVVFNPEPECSKPLSFVSRIHPYSRLHLSKAKDLSDFENLAGLVINERPIIFIKL